MNQDRLIAVAMFSFSGGLVWILFIILLGESPFSWFNLTGLISSIIAPAAITYLMSPRIYKKEQSKRTKVLASFYGVGITFLSFFLGSAIFFGFDLIQAENALTFKMIQELISVVLMGFLIATTLMSPGYILGAFTGIMYVKRLNRKEAEI
ncbi:MAG TPA: hypothetical protein DCX27_13140 [Balneola sp.]|nr:hypothetical protein [Balneola sp.]